MRPDSITGVSRPDGCQQGSVYGTYVHGVLDGDAVAGAIVRALAEKKGINVFSTELSSFAVGAKVAALL